MTIPSKVYIREVGPREGFQIEKKVYPTEEKVRLIESLAQTGLPEIEVCSFVRPDLVPQMADAEQTVESLRTFPGVKYSGIYLNQRGLERALALKKLEINPKLSLSASETFSKSNTNVSIQERIKSVSKRAEIFKNLQFKSIDLGVSAAFGCNYEGDIPLEKVLEMFRRLEEIAKSHQLEVSHIELLDTMGWANPLQVSKAVEAVRKEWPSVSIGLHLHDTRGLGIANAYAGLQMGVSHFDASIGGLGGCPFSGQKRAAGNIATEELVFLCQELGVETGVNLDLLIDSVSLAEEIIDRPLSGKLKNGGNLSSYRS